MSFVEDGNKELDEYEEKLINENITVKEIISSTNSSFKEIEIGDVKIRIKHYMPKKIRTQTFKIGKELQTSNEDEILEVESKIYPIVAGMCVDDPFTRERTWEKIDESTGCIQDVLLKILTEVNKTDEQIKSFRKNK